MIATYFGDCLLQMLLVTAVAYTGVDTYKNGWEHSWIDGISIIVAILIIFILKHKKNVKKKESNSNVMSVVATRGGVRIQVDSTELVVGDIIEIQAGSTIPADCIVIESSDLALNEAMLTGEPD